MKKKSITEKSVSRILFAMRALRNRNYRLFSMGQIISLVGSWVQFVAITWLAYRLTNSEVLMGIIAFAGQIPSFVLTPFAGVLVDRYNKHSIVVATQAASLLQAALLAWLTLSGHVTPMWLVTLNLMLGIINAVDMPARQALIAELLENKEDLNNAIAINSLTFNSARVIGPAMAGFIIVLVGEGLCFAINAVSFLGTIYSLLLMRFDKVTQKKNNTEKNIIAELKDGVRYIKSVNIIAYTLLLLAVTNFLGTAHFVIMPIYVDKILHQGPHALSLMMTFMGAGAVLGAVLLTLKKSTRRLESIIAYTAVMFGIALFVLAYTTDAFYAYSVMFVAGFCFISLLVAANTTLQSTVENDKRGRVMSFYALALVGVSPFGNLAAGFIAANYGIVATLLLAGLINVVAGLVYKAVIRKKVLPAV